MYYAWKYGMPNKINNNHGTPDNSGTPNNAVLALFLSWIKQG